MRRGTELSSPYSDQTYNIGPSDRVSTGHPPKSSPLPFIIGLGLFVAGVTATILGIFEFGWFDSKGWLLPTAGYLSAGLGVPLMFGWDKITQQKLLIDPNSLHIKTFERLLSILLVPSLLVSVWNLWWLADFLATLATELVRS
jgi:hypothetical protein